MSYNMDQKLDLRQIGTIFGHAIYVDLADMPDVTETGEILSERDKAEYQVRTTVQEAFGMPPSKPTPIEETASIQSVCPIVDCKAIYTTRYSVELNHMAEPERKNILKQSYTKQVRRAELDHKKGLHNVSER